MNKFYLGSLDFFITLLMCLMKLFSMLKVAKQIHTQFIYWIEFLFFLFSWFILCELFHLKIFISYLDWFYLNKNYTWTFVCIHEHETKHAILLFRQTTQNLWEKKIKNFKFVCFKSYSKCSILFEKKMKIHLFLFCSFFYFNFSYNLVWRIYSFGLTQFYNWFLIVGVFCNISMRSLN